jgi:cellobiose phosphorylase
LIVDPQLPEKELPVTVCRTFRNCRYEITIRKGQAKSLAVDGKNIAYGTPIPPKENAVLHIECEI